MKRSWRSPGDASLRSLATVLLVALVASLGVGTSIASEKDKCKAKDANHNGEIEPGETQDCGGEEYGNGGDDGASLPPAHEDANTHQWGPYHWTKPQNDERKIIIRDSIVDSNTYNDKLGNVLSDWGQSAKFRFVRQAAETDATTRQNCPMPGSYGRVRVCNYDYTFSAAGKAGILPNSQNHIQRGWVKVKNNVSSEAVKRPLLCQEVGHTLGLDHRATTDSCMHQNAAAASSSPDRHDYEQLGNQTHHHGGESETGGALSDLDTGGGLLDGCTQYTCFEVLSSGKGHHEAFLRTTKARTLASGQTMVVYSWYFVDLPFASFLHRLI